MGGQRVHLDVVQASEVIGYRHRARLAVRGSRESPLIGIFERGSHRAVDIPRCSVHHPKINQTVRRIRRVLIEHGIEPYSETVHSGLVRYLQLVVERSSQRVQLVVVANALGAEPLLPLLERLPNALGGDLHSLFFSLEPRRTNTILGSPCHHVCGPAATSERIAGARAMYPPDAFGQNNPAMYERIVERIGTWVADGSDVTEYYAGVGAIGLSLMGRARVVRFNEVAPGSLRGLELGLAAVGHDARRAELAPGKAGERASLYHRDDDVIVDPPRKGLDPELLARLVAEPPRQLIYLSCDTDSLLADSRALLSSQLQLTEAVAFDLFPFTGRVETLARFQIR